MHKFTYLGMDIETDDKKFVRELFNKVLERKAFSVLPDLSYFDNPIIRENTGSGAELRKIHNMSRGIVRAKKPHSNPKGHDRRKYTPYLISQGANKGKYAMRAESGYMPHCDPKANRKSVGILYASYGIPLRERAQGAGY